MTISGVYVMPPPLKYAPKVYATPGISGVCVVADRATFQPQAPKWPADGSIPAYDATLLYQDLSQIPAGLSILPVVRLGCNDAPWAAQLPGGIVATVDIPAHYHATGPTECAVPAPWTDAFLEATMGTTSALRDALERFPGGSLMPRVSGVTLSLADWFDAEMQVPILPDWKGNSAIWAKAGFRPSLMLSAWQRYLDDVAQKFPDADYVMSTWEGTSGHSMPWVDDQGNLLQKADPNQLDGYVAYAAKNYGSRAHGIFVSLDETTSPTDGPIGWWAKAQDLGMSFDCQFVTGTVAKPWPKTEKQALDAAEIGAKAGAGSIQMHWSSVVAFPDLPAKIAAILAAN